MLMISLHLVVYVITKTMVKSCIRCLFKNFSTSDGIQYLIDKSLSDDDDDDDEFDNPLSEENWML